MKNIFILDDYISSKTNGIGPFIKAYIMCLKKMDVNINILSFNNQVNEFNIIIKDGIRKFVFPPFPCGNFNRNYTIVNRFLKCYIKDSSENVFCFNHAPCLELLIIVRKSYPLSKLIFTIHDMSWCKPLNGNSSLLADIISNSKKNNAKYQSVIEAFITEKQMYNIVDAVICLSESTKIVLKDIYAVDIDKIHLIPSGIRRLYQSTDNNRTITRGQYFLKNEEKIILYVGRLSYAKGVFPLLEAFAEILTTHSDVRLVMCGSANKTWQLFFQSAQKVVSKIVLTGFISKQELLKLYQIADIGIIPSYYEQCPYVGMEMMMHSLPLIISDCNGLKDMFQDGINAKIAKIGDRAKPSEFKNNLKHAMIELLDNNYLRDQLGQNAKKTYTSEFSICSMRKRYIEFYSKL